MPGVTPAKWVRTWRERMPETALTLVRVTAAEAEAAVRARDADAALLRLPVDRTGLHAIPLYTETTVVVVPKDHFLAAGDELAAEELAEDVLLHPLDDVLEWTEPLPGKPAIDRPETTADAVELVAAGVGLLVMPQSLARLHHRKELTYRPLPSAPTSQVALSWLEDEPSELMEQMIGIVRGRTVNSSRGVQQQTPAEKPKPAEKSKPAERRKTAAGTNRQRSAGTPKGRGKTRRRG